MAVLFHLNNIKCNL